MTLAPLAKRNPHEGGDNTQWQRKPRAGRRRPARNAKFFFARKTKGAPVRNVAAPFLLYDLPRLKSTNSSPNPVFRHLHAVPHPHAANDIPLLNLIDDLHPGDHAAEDGVLRVEMRLR